MTIQVSYQRTESGISPAVNIVGTTNLSTDEIAYILYFLSTGDYAGCFVDQISKLSRHHVESVSKKYMALMMKENLQNKALHIISELELSQQPIVDSI